MRAFPQCNAPFVQGDLKQWTKLSSLWHGWHFTFCQNICKDVQHAQQINPIFCISGYTIGCEWFQIWSSMFCFSMYTLASRCMYLLLVVSRSRHSCGGWRVVFAKVHSTINVHVKSSLTTIENALRFGIESYSSVHICRLVSHCVVRGSSSDLGLLSYKIAVVKLMIGFRPILYQTLWDGILAICFSFRCCCFILFLFYHIHQWKLLSLLCLAEYAPGCFDSSGVITLSVMFYFCTLWCHGWHQLKVH